jgi:hypothetical protein
MIEPQTRRHFLRLSLGVVTFATGLRAGEIGPPPKLKAVIIGHTGHGDYGQIMI